MATLAMVKTAAKIFMVAVLVQPECVDRLEELTSEDIPADDGDLRKE